MIAKKMVRSFALFFLGVFFSGPAALIAMPPVQKLELPSNLVVLVSEEHTLPFVTLELLIDSGSWRDPSQKEGLANLTSEAILLGTASRDLSEINEALDFMGSSLESSCGRDFVSLSLRSLKKNYDEGFELFMEVLTRPDFPRSEVERKVDEIKGKIQASEEDPGEVAEKAFRRAVFLRSPYAHPVEGTPESLSRISRDEVAEFYRSYYRPSHSILTVVGDITLEEIEKKILPRLSAWRDERVAEKPFRMKFAGGPRSVKINRTLTQATIILGNGGIERTNPDYYAISVMNNILGGGGFSSRLMEEIRIKRGLAYSVYSQFITHKHPGTFQIILQTKNESAREAISIAVEQMKKMQREPVSEQELETAKKYLIGSFPLRLVTQSSLARFLAQAEYYGLGQDYPEKYPSLIGSVTREDVLKAARNYLHPEKIILTVVADMDQANLEGPNR